jgi:protein-L-isoaspartate(D-aspartate) O-methyltransferase
VTVGPDFPGHADFPGDAEIRGMTDRFVDQMKAMDAIGSAAVERAFRKVPRHRLLETFYHRASDGAVTTTRNDPAHPRRDHLALIYTDDALATRRAGGLPVSSTSQPSLMARMLEFLGLADGMKILEVGAGTGYNAALMAEIVGDQRLVVTVDVLEDVVDQTRRLLAAAGYGQIQVLLRDGFDGVPEQAPFDRIMATVGCSDLSPNWAGQLAGDGAMLVPLAHGSGHPLVLVRKDGDVLRGRLVLRTGFIPVRGPLRIEDLWVKGVRVTDPAETVHEPDSAPRFTPRRPDEPIQPADDENDFVFYLGLHDRRACSRPTGPTLSAGPYGWATLAPDGIQWWGEESLARELDRRYREWDARGRPALEDYLVTFVPVQDGGDGPPGGWKIERRFYHELLTLG